MVRFRERWFLFSPILYIFFVFVLQKLSQRYGITGNFTDFNPVIYDLYVHLAFSEVFNRSMNSRWVHHPMEYYEGFNVVPFERFGNNLFQLLRIIKYCKVFHFHRIVIPKNFALLKRDFVSHNISFEIRTKTTAVNKLLKGQFYFPLRKFPIPMDYSGFDCFREEFLSRIPNMSLHKDDLYLHIRSGDIFKSKRPHKNYGQPPLNYFVDIIKYKKWRKVYLISEDTNNPVAPYLIKRGASFTRNSFFKDITIILNSHNLAIGKSTLGLSLSYLNRNGLKTLFTFNLPTYRILPHYNCDPDEAFAIGIINRWKNFKFQQKILLTSKCQSWKFYYTDTSMISSKARFHNDNEYIYWFL